MIIDYARFEDVRRDRSRVGSLEAREKVSIATRRKGGSGRSVLRVESCGGRSGRMTVVEMDSWGWGRTGDTSRHDDQVQQAQGAFACWLDANCSEICEVRSNRTGCSHFNVD